MKDIVLTIPMSEYRAIAHRDICTVSKYKKDNRVIAKAREVEELQ